jgi:hypothetical protein
VVAARGRERALQPFLRPIDFVQVGIAFLPALVTIARRMRVSSPAALNARVAKRAV